MANLRKWSTTATGNASVAGGANTINFAEGQTPGSVNNSARELMAQMRSQYTPDNWGWVEHSATASVASQTTFKISGNQTTHWTAGRRWRLKSGSTTRYGAVVSSSYTTETTVTVTVDSGSLSASHSLAALSVIDSNHVPANGGYLTSASLATALGAYVTSSSLATALGTYVTSSSLATALSPYITSNSVSAAIANYVTSNSASIMIASQISSGAKYTLLGTLTTTSGASQALTSLTLTGYKRLYIVVNGVSYNTGSGQTLNLNGVAISQTFNSTAALTGFTDLDLTTGVAASTLSTGSTPAAAYGLTTVTTATTTLTFAPSSGTFDAGSIVVYAI